jgi:hypothetical protein
VENTGHQKLTVSDAIAAARSAYKSGALKEHEPLKAAGVGYDYSTPLAAWGPLMMR